MDTVEESVANPISAVMGLPFALGEPPLSSTANRSRSGAQLLKIET